MDYGFFLTLEFFTDSGDLLPIEKQNIKLKKKIMKQQKESEAELQLNIENQETFKFPTKESEEEVKSLQVRYPYN